MTLKGLLPLLALNREYRGLVDWFRRGRTAGQITLSEPALAYCLAVIRKDLEAPVLVLSARPEKARRLYEDLLVWCGEAGDVYQFPEGEALPFERLVADDATTHRRLETLEVLVGGTNDQRQPPIVVASVAAIGQKTIARDIFEASLHRLARGQRVDLQGLIQRWEGMGYRMERAVEVPGTMSRRGGILDIYPPRSDLPARIELLGDVVESIRLFDPVSQRSVKLLEEVSIQPAHEVLPALARLEDVEKRHRYVDFSSCTQAIRERIEEELSMLMADHTHEGLGFYQGFFCTGTLLDFFPSRGLIVIDGLAEVEEEGLKIEDRTRALREIKEARGELPRNFPSLHISWRQIKQGLERVSRRLYVEPWVRTGVHGSEVPCYEPGFTTSRSYRGRLDTLVKEAQELRLGGDRVVVVSHHAARLAEVFREQGVSVDEDVVIQECPQRGSITLIRGSLAEGWSLPIDGSILYLLTDVEVMGRAKERPLRRKVPAQRSAFLSELEPGNYAVHVEHGIGRFTGTRRMEVGEGEKEYLVLEYAEGDKLYVPTEQLDRLSLFMAAGERPPALTRLGTQEWSRIKERTRVSTREIAQQLLVLYATREIVEGLPFSRDMPWQRELEDSFPYVETRDQIESIAQVKEDMESSRPMDRLVCGDVGYGKTEVALRAAFKALMDGMQVAVLVPTTVLAQQHYATFTQRMAPFPVQVEVLSRFRTDQEQRDVVEGLTSGKVDICIGTHRLLQKDVAFKNLGLVIVDEEQRFGVSHKERFKEMRKDVDVLTLSATPIPRTLHMVLSGIRDMSTMETPPEERLPIKTYISEYSEEVIREAILREVDRGGQVFFLHNRVHTIESTAERVRNIVPEARIAVAHGRMTENRLEQIMSEFAQGGYDVLVCTTIIEAGLDIPNVNTLIIDRADMLGLAQLYQLRGRVGRGANRAYSYLLVPRGRHTTEAAEKRLKTILAATELGAGFRIAMRDLEIRGAGNILGSEQSGYIHAVGYDLYSQMLGQAVEEVRGQRDEGLPEERETPEARIDLPLAAYIPLDYIPDLTTRLGVYQRLAKLRRREEASSLAEEVRDRFGHLPEAVKNLLYVVEVKAQARAAGAEAVVQNGDVVMIKLKEPVGGARIALQKALGNAAYVGHSQLRLHLRDGGREVLMKTLERVAAFRAEVMELPGIR